MPRETALHRNIEAQRDRFSKGAKEPVHVEPVGHDRNHPPAGSEPFPGRAQMAGAGIPIVPALDALRIGRVDEGRARHLSRVEQLVDELAVVAAHRGLGEQDAEAVTAQRRYLVEDQARARSCRPDCQHAGPGRRLEDGLALAERAGARGKPGNAWRRRELLQLDLLLAAHSLARQQCLEPGECCASRGGWRSGRQPGAALQPQHLGELERRMGIAHRPAAIRIAAAELTAEDGIQPLAGDGFVRLNERSKLTGRGQDRRLAAIGKGKDGG